MDHNLNAVAWDKLYHAYGPSTDVPEQIRMLTQPETDLRAQARVDLVNNLAYQGTRWEASAYVLPFLSNLIMDTSTPDRAMLLNHMLFIALGDAWLDDRTLPYPDQRFDAVVGWQAADHHEVVIRMVEYPESLTSDDHTILAQLGIVWARDAYIAMQTQAERLLRWAVDAKTARYAIAGIPWFANIHQAAIPIIAPILMSDDHPIENRVTALITIGLIPNGREAMGTIREYALNTHAPHGIRLAGAIASGLIMGAEADPAALDVLVEAENWRKEMNTLTDQIPYRRPLMGFHSLALANMGL